MTDKKSAKDDAETQEAEAPEAQVENENGEVLDSPTVNAHVVGVTISEGGGDPQSAKAKAKD